MALLRDTETWFAINGYFTDRQEMKLQIVCMAHNSI